MEHKKVNGIKNGKAEIQVKNSKNMKGVCDCMDETCIGCFLPCENCNSTKCGHVCRIGRKWNYKEWKICNGSNDENLEGSDQDIETSSSDN